MPRPVDVPVELAGASLLQPLTTAEMQAFEDVVSLLTRLDAQLRAAPAAIQNAVLARGLLADIARAWSAAATPLEPLDLYCALHRIALPDPAASRISGGPWALRTLYGGGDWQALAAQVRLLRRYAAALDGAPNTLARPVRLADWVGAAPALPADAAAAPRLLRALEQLRLALRVDGERLEALLALPWCLADQRLTATPLPGLAIVHRQLALERMDARRVRPVLLARLGTAASDTLGLLARLASDRAYQHQISADAKKPGNLLRLADLLLACPLVSPQLVAGRLAMGLPEAGQLCQRAARLGLLAEMTGRKSWKIYAAVHVRDRYGIKVRSQPAPTPLPAPTSDPALRPMLDAVDALLAEIGSQRSA